MRNLSLIAALIATTLSSTAVADDWVFIGANADGDKYYINRDSIRMMQNGYKRAWIQNVFAQLRAPADPVGIATLEEENRHDLKASCQPLAPRQDSQQMPTLHRSARIDVGSGNQPVPENHRQD